MDENATGWWMLTRVAYLPWHPFSRGHAAAGRGIFGDNVACDKELHELAPCLLSLGGEGGVDGRELTGEC